MPRCEDSPIIGAVRVDRLPDGSGAVVWVSGEQDLSNAAVLARALESAAAYGGHVVADISGVTFLSAAMLHAMVRARDELARSSTTLAVRAPSAFARRMLDICGLSELVDPPRPPARRCVASSVRPRALVGV